MVLIPDIKSLYQKDKVSKMKERPQKERLFSSMTWGILLFNSFALAILAGSLVYAKNYQNVLLNRESVVLQEYAQTYGETILETAVVVDSIEHKTSKVALDKKKAGLMILRFAEKRHQRIILFDKDNKVLVDSNDLTQYDKNSSSKGRNYLLSFFQKERTVIEDVMRAVASGISSRSWTRISDDVVHVHAGYPIVHGGDRLGAVLVSASADFMKGVTGAMELEIIVIFVGTLCFTIILSIYFSRQLAKPLRQLANYADAVRQNFATDIQPPDFSSRDDEIGDLSLALREMTESLRQRMESIEQFAADVSHELKNPLTSIQSALETLPKVDDKKKQQQLKTIIEQDILRMDRLITDISRASRLDAQLIKEMMEPFDLKQTLRDNIHIQNDLISRLIKEEKIEAKNISIHFLDASSKDKVMVNGLSARLAQVFDNVIINAASFSPDNAAITITLMCDDEYAMVIIDDEGTGIPEGNVDKIFERFYTDRPQVNAVAKNSSGLGLNISKQIVEAHKGTIWAENREDDDGNIEGARFIVLIPVIRKKYNESPE